MEQDVAAAGATGQTRLVWNNQHLELPSPTPFEPGEKVTWCIPPEQVLLHRRDRQGGDPEDWPLVCEEIEANAEDGEQLGRSLRSLLDDCTRWPDLWSGLDVPPRDEVREALAMFLYRPVPKDQPLD